MDGWPWKRKDDIMLEIKLEIAIPSVQNPVSSKQYVNRLHLYCTFLVLSTTRMVSL